PLRQSPRATRSPRSRLATRGCPKSPRPEIGRRTLKASAPRSPTLFRSLGYHAADGPARDCEGRGGDAGLRPPPARRTGPRDLGPPPRVRRGPRGARRLDPAIPPPRDPRTPRSDVRPHEGGTGDHRRPLQARALEEPGRRMGRGEAGPPGHPRLREAGA